MRVERVDRRQAGLVTRMWAVKGAGRVAAGAARKAATKKFSCGFRRPGARSMLLVRIALEAVRRIDALFEIERSINGQPPDVRLEVRKQLSEPLVTNLERWLRGERAMLSKHAKVAKAIDYLLSPNHRPGFTVRRRIDPLDQSVTRLTLEDGRVCLTNNAAERALRGVALGRKSWLFAGSERGGHRAAAMYTLIGTAKLNGIDPQAWLADVIARISDMPVSRLHELLPWNWKPAGKTESSVKAA